MRIGFDAKRVFLNNTGLGNYSRDTINLLSSYIPSNEYFLYTTEINKNPRTSFISARNNIFIQKPKSLLNKTFKTYWRSKNIIKDLYKDNIEIYHGLSNEIPLGIEKTSIKSLVTIHDLIFIRYPHFFNTTDRKIYFKKFQSSCKRADKIIAVSEQTKKDIINFFSISKEKIHVVYQGCNQVFQNKIENNDIKHVLKKHKMPQDFLLYVGTIEERKNLLTLLKSLKELPNQTLIVIGNGTSYKLKCEKFILENQLNKRVIFLSNLILKDIAAIYKAAKIMIYPSIFEGFGIPIIESLFSNTPVITSKDGCFIEAGGPNTKYVNPLSVLEIKNAIKEIDNSSELQKIMTSKGFKYAQKFTDKVISNNLMEIYNKL